MSVSNAARLSKRARPRRSARTDEPLDANASLSHASQGLKPRRLARNAELARYLNTTAMSIWRWQRDRELKFPQPFVINDISYTDLDKVDAWLRTRVRNLRK